MRANFDCCALGAFALRFALVFAVLLTPWPGWSAAYGAYFRAAGESFCDAVDGRGAVQFAATSDGPLDTSVTLKQADSGKETRGTIDSRSIGYVPTALVCALVLASALPWGRAVLSLVTALVVTQGFIFFTLQCWVWANTSPGLADGPNAIGHRIAEELDYTLVNQLGASFSVPVLVWAFVTFRKQDVLRAS